MTCSPDDLESTSGLSADCAGLVLTAPLERCAARCERAEGESVERPKPPATAREFEHALYFALGWISGSRNAAESSLCAMRLHRAMPLPAGAELLASQVAVRRVPQHVRVVRRRRS